MQAWKLLLGAGAACAACCAVPLVGVVAAGTLGGTALGWAGSALAGEIAVAAAAILALGAAGLGRLWWRRRAARQATACGCPGGGCGAPR